MHGLIKKISKAFRLAVMEPRTLYRYCKCYLISTPSKCILMVNGVRFQIDTDLDSAIIKMYHGLYQREIVSLLKIYLRQGDTFLDVGANIGYISAIGLSLVGKTGEVHSFEPVPRFFKKLSMIQVDNPAYHIYPNNIALGDDEGVSRIAVTNLKNIGWNTMVPGLMSDETTGETIDVPVVRLDTYICSNNIQNIRLIKIDTEGYEFPVIKGISGYLRDSKQFPIFIIEIEPTAYSLLNLSLKDFQELMRGLGYVGYTLDGKRPIDVSRLRITTDVLFLH